MPEPLHEPQHIDHSAVDQLVAAARAWRASDYHYGGGACRDAVRLSLARGEKLLAALATDDVKTALYAALADLHNLAGWTCFDTGLIPAAHTHLHRALSLARRGRHRTLIANIHYRIGRVHLHHHAPHDAMKHFTLGQTAAAASGSPHAAAILFANQAWAHATLAQEPEALTALRHSRDAFARTDTTDAPSWAAFFGDTDLTAMIGTVHAELAQTVGRRHLRTAIPALTHVVDTYPDTMARSTALTMTALATCHLLDGDIEHATNVGHRAATLAETLSSTRPADRMGVLRNEAGRHPRDTDLHQLSQRIAALTTRQPHHRQAPTSRAPVSSTRFHPARHLGSVPGSSAGTNDVV